MAIQEHMELGAQISVDRPQPVSRSEWTARPLRPVAQWVLVAAQEGTARLEMVWSTPDPQPSDALR